MNRPLSADILAALAAGETIVLSEGRTIPPNYPAAWMAQARDECRRALMGRASEFLLDGTTVAMQMAWEEGPDDVRPMFGGQLRKMDVRLYLKLLPDHPLVRRRP